MFEVRSSQTFPHINTPKFSNLVILHIYPPMKMEQSVPKRRHIKFRRRGITQKKSIQHSEHGESLKSRIEYCFTVYIRFSFYSGNYENKSECCANREDFSLCGRMKCSVVCKTGTNISEKNTARQLQECSKMQLRYGRKVFRCSSMRKYTIVCTNP